jgi:hypothetical protein
MSACWWTRLEELFRDADELLEEDFFILLPLLLVLLFLLLLCGIARQKQVASASTISMIAPTIPQPIVKVQILCRISRSKSSRQPYGNDCTFVRSFVASK